MKIEKFFRWFDTAAFWLVRAITVASAGLGAYFAWKVTAEMDIGLLTRIGVIIATAIVCAVVVRIAIWIMSIGS